MINDEHRRRKGVTSSFLTNPVYVYNTIMAASVFGDIVEKALCQLAFEIVIRPVTSCDGMGAIRHTSQSPLVLEQQPLHF